MKLAMYKTKYNTEIVFEADDYAEENPDYIRISEIIEVEFTDRDNKEVNKEQVAAVDRKIDEARAAYQVLMNGLEDEKAKLLAIEAPE